MTNNKLSEEEKKSLEMLLTALSSTSVTVNDILVHGYKGTKSKKFDDSKSLLLTNLSNLLVLVDLMITIDMIDFQTLRELTQKKWYLLKEACKDDDTTRIKK